MSGLMQNKHDMTLQLLVTELKHPNDFRFETNNADYGNKQVKSVTDETSLTHIQ
jgi:hypothetical protein